MLIGTVLASLITSVIYALNRLRFYGFSRWLLVMTSFLYFYVHAVYVAPARYVEYLYILVLLLIMVLFDSFKVQLLSLLLLHAAFYLPNWIFDIYKEQPYGSANIVVLFGGLFASIRFFINLNERNERALLKDKKLISLQNEELEALQIRQKSFFENVSHELKTPLTLINGQLNASQSIELEIKEKIQGHVRATTDMINELLTISTSGSSSKTSDLNVIDVNQLVFKTYLTHEAMFQQSGIHLSHKLRTNSALILGNHGDLERCINSLLSNAFKVLSKEKEVQLITELLSEKVIISVRDNGPGIPLDIQGKVFDRFFSTAVHEGFGIGLSYVKETVEALNGRIELKSEIGFGTQFDLIFDKVNTQIDPLTAKSMKNKKSNTLLIVEDNDEMATYISDVFHTYDCTCVSDGLEAQKLLKKEYFDCIITDYMMPNVNGLELLEYIKEKNISSSTVLLTAYAGSEIKYEALREGVDDYLTKPFEEEELRLIVTNLLNATSNWKRQIQNN